MTRDVTNSRKKTQTFAERFAAIEREFGTRYRLAKASGVPESTLQVYSRPEAVLPPRADILIKLARAANVSLDWLATGRGEMRQEGLIPGAQLSDAVMVEMRDPRAALVMEQIVAYLPFSRGWLEHRLGLSDHERLMLLETEEELPPEIKRGDLLLADTRSRGRAPGRDGVYLLTVTRGLAVRKIQIRVNKTYRVSSSEISEDVRAAELSRLVVGEVVWRGGRL
jgi:transcriptional regulator with XRE-family HTH domain